jgi:hypothetical protein
MTRNQERQLQHLRRINPRVGAQVAAEVARLDDTDEIQTVISRGLFTHAGWLWFVPDVTMRLAEAQDVALYDPQWIRRHGQWMTK